MLGSCICGGPILTDRHFFTAVFCSVLNTDNWAELSVSDVMNIECRASTCQNRGWFSRCHRLHRHPSAIFYCSYDIYYLPYFMVLISVFVIQLPILVQILYSFCFNCSNIVSLYCYRLVNFQNHFWVNIWLFYVRCFSLVISVGDRIPSWQPSKKWHICIDKPLNRIQTAVTFLELWLVAVLFSGCWIFFVFIYLKCIFYSTACLICNVAWNAITC